MNVWWIIGLTIAGVMALWLAMALIGRSLVSDEHRDKMVKVDWRNEWRVWGAMVLTILFLAAVGAWLVTVMR
jgi:hypothetical protein